MRPSHSGDPSPSDRTEPAPAPAIGIGFEPEHLYKAVGLFFLFLLFYANFAAISEVLLVVYASAILAIALNVIVGLAPRHRAFISIAIGLLLLGAVALTLWFAIPPLAAELRQLFEQLPFYQQQLQEWSLWLREKTGFNVDLLGPGTRAFVGRMLRGGDILARAGGFFEGILIPLLIILGSLFAIANPNHRLLDPLLYVVPRSRRESFRRMFLLLGVRLRGWVKGTLIGMLVVGALVTLGLWVLGVQFTLLLGILAGLLEIVPIIGPWVSAAAAVTVALMQDPTKAVWVALLMFAVQQLESNLILPLVMSKAAEVHPFVALFALYFFGNLFGFLGVILALPLVLLIWTVVEVLWVERVLGTEHDRFEPLVREASE